METTFRAAASRVNLVVGPLVMLIGVLGAIAAVVLSLAMQTAWFLLLLVPAVVAVGAGALLLRGARRACLRIGPDGFTWAGFVGARQTVRWQSLDRLLPPAPGDPRLVATALLRDGTPVPVRALWEPPTLPSAFSGGPAHAQVQGALLEAHRRWLAAHR